MGATTAIGWTDATVNFWWGCTKVGPGCDHCYAEAWAKRTGETIWGANQARKKIKSALSLLRRLGRAAPKFRAEYGRSRRVFIQSMSDLFDADVPLEWFGEAFHSLAVESALDIQIVTKRLPNVEKRLAAIGVSVWPAHVGLMASVVDQIEADRDVPRLLALKAKLNIPWVGVSAEPLLGPIDLEPWLAWPDDRVTLDWIIVGGESGPDARPMHPDWARSIRDQCNTAGVPFFFKQWGEWTPGENVSEDICGRRPNATWFGGQWMFGETRMEDPEDGWADDIDLYRIGKRAAGRMIDGVEHNGFPLACGKCAS